MLTLLRNSAGIKSYERKKRKQRYLKFGFWKTKPSESEKLMNMKDARNNARNKSHVG